ncbi:GyrI-like domain-containing protein [Muriicola marianensis]|nr:GyrI-like domain-containing protein [Muriicola marianensis]
MSHVTEGELSPVLRHNEPIKLIGMSQTMSQADYSIGELWRRFMPRRREIKNSLSKNLISMTLYDQAYFKKYDPARKFQKWAGMAVADLSVIPHDMETFKIPAGLYAVFHYRGLSTDKSVYQYIFGSWLPASGFILDNRPHFEVLGENYRNNDPDSEEEIWIPIEASPQTV